MGLKKRNKVSAEFSMSSLTDIIFLLLIFFMLTANFVQIKPFDLPESDSKTVAPTSVAVAIEKNGTFSLNGKDLSFGKLERAVSVELAKAENKNNATITIAAEIGTPFENVIKVMNIAKKLKVKAILATQARQ
ncbi:MAG: ExbD/TolR family protein [Saprospiraceae bacterium]